MFRLRNRIYLILVCTLLVVTADVRPQFASKQAVIAAPALESPALAANHAAPNALMATTAAILLPCQPETGNFVYLPMIVARGNGRAASGIQRHHANQTPRRPLTAAPFTTFTKPPASSTPAAAPRKPAWPRASSTAAA